MASIVSIETKRADQAIISILEEWLRMAKDGEIVSLALAGVLHDNATCNSFSAPISPVSLLGELQILQRDVLDICIDTRMHEAGTLY